MVIVQINHDHCIIIRYACIYLIEKQRKSQGGNTILLSLPVMFQICFYLFLSLFKLFELLVSTTIHMLCDALYTMLSMKHFLYSFIYSMKKSLVQHLCCMTKCDIELSSSLCNQTMLSKTNLNALWWGFNTIIMVTGVLLY